jgi:predicted PurR-regulated permease PerM
MERRIRRRRWAVWIAVMAGIGALLFLFWPTVQKMLITMAAAVAISFLLSPIVNVLEKWMPRWLGITVTYGVILAALGFVLYLVVPGLFKQGSMLVGQLPDYIKTLERVQNDISIRMQDMGLPRDILGKWDDIVANMQTGITERAGNFVTSVPDRVSFLPELVAIPVITFYLVSDQKKVRQTTTRCIPARYRENARKLAGRIRRVLYGFIQGELVNALVVGVLTTIAFLAIGLPYPLLLGTLAGACEIIPYFGPYISVIPIAIVVLIEVPDKIWWTLGVIFIIQQIQGSVISPIILSGHIRLHPVAVILLLLAGLAAGGIIGMVVILPLALIVREVVEFTYQRIVYTKTLLRITRGDS